MCFYIYVYILYIWCICMYIFINNISFGPRKRLTLYFIKTKKIFKKHASSDGKNTNFVLRRASHTLLVREKTGGGTGKKEKKRYVSTMITNKTTVFVTLRRHRTGGARVRERSRARYRGPTAGPHRVRLCTSVTAAPEPLSLSAAAARKQHARTHRRPPARPPARRTHKRTQKRAKDARTNASATRHTRQTRARTPSARLPQPPPPTTS